MARIQVVNYLLPGVALLNCPFFPDARGSFTKLYHQHALAEQGFDVKVAESFLTKSAAGVLRGMHFQVGKAAHDKLVCCLKGRVLDVVVDIRPDSPHFNQPVSIELSESEPTALLIGKGYAHGFLALEDESWMLYSTSTVHQPALDRGVLWSSIDFDWPLQHPLLSQRDQQHPSIHSWQ